ncbi:hypothetical protein Y032_0042g693 [Ancylostoma ceylanicum]|uniref:Uncharacterized protein n=1 Tax=Ancylostoma ceylanicum TaxID=53326 RepID=A0A016UGZ8_9BILA|nr:hypothetical protein Y032_0042g693 [Ancylostoma ceylanicum]
MKNKKKRKKKEKAELPFRTVPLYGSGGKSIRLPQYSSVRRGSPRLYLPLKKEEGKIKTLTIMWVLRETMRGHACTDRGSNK